MNLKFQLTIQIHPQVLKFKVLANGIFSALPYIPMWFASLGSGVLSDWLINNKYISITASRKLFTTIGRSMEFHLIYKHMNTFFLNIQLLLDQQFSFWQLLMQGVIEF